MAIRLGACRLQAALRKPAVLMRLQTACVTWAVEAKRGAGTVCLTADGVALRGEGAVNGRQGSFIATSVAYGPVAADLFSPPPGYFAMNFPSLGRLR